VAAAVALEAALAEQARRGDGGASTAELVASVRELKRKLGEAEALVSEISGRPLIEPADLPDRFKQAAVLAAVQQALAEAAPGAEVSSVDCSEYPCIAYTRGLSRSESEGLTASLKAGGYQDDSRGMLGLPGTTGVILTPKNDPNEADNTNATRRLLFRFEQMWEASSMNASSNSPH
jgi:hypothetical protein